MTVRVAHPLLCLGLLLVVVPQAHASRGQGLQPCTYQVGDLPPLVEQARAGLERDAFADAYETYLRDLEALQDDLDAWVDEVDAYVRNECHVFTSAVQVYERDRLDYEAACAHRPITEDELPECQYRKSQLDLRYGVLIRRKAETDVKEAGFNARGQSLGAKAQPAFDHAALVLDPAHVEDALRLYISWVQKQSSGNACGDFAVIAEKLGERVTKQPYFLGYLVRNLAGHERGLDLIVPPADVRAFRFDASGFIPRFYANVGENQVRHALAYMAVGYTYNGTAADLVSQLRDELRGEPQDYWLGVEAGHMGFQLSKGVYDTRNFGRAIRGRLCE